jgi:hypothetical protein
LYSAGKVLFAAFLDAENSLLFEYLHCGSKINTDSTTLELLKKVILLHNNAHPQPEAGNVLPKPCA